MKNQLTREQKQYYKDRLLYYQNGIYDKKDRLYSDYYLYEIANLTYDHTAEDAVRRLFAVRDRIHAVYDNNAYMIRLCESMMVAYPPCTDQLVYLLQSKGICSYQAASGSSDMALGDYTQAEAYVKTYARGIKSSDLDYEKVYLKHAWLALSEVFYQLEDSFRDYRGYLRESVDGLYGVAGFRQIISAGSEESLFLNLYELDGGYHRPFSRIVLSKTVSLECVKGRGDKAQWVRKSWKMYDVTKDLLYVIFLYTESFMRQALHGPKKKRSVEKIVKKNYKKNQEEARIVHLVRQYITNVRFEKGIEKGVEEYLRQHPELLPPPTEKKTGKKAGKGIGDKSDKKERKKSVAQVLKEMDLGQRPDVRDVDPGLLQDARRDSDQVLNLLHVDEIDYKGKQTASSYEALFTESQSSVDQNTKDSQENDIFTPDEMRYLMYLYKDMKTEKENLMKRLGTSERLLVKSINEKSMNWIEDVVVEQDGGSYVLVEDYLDDLKGLGEEKEWL